MEQAIDNPHYEDWTIQVLVVEDDDLDAAVVENLLSRGKHPAFELTRTRSLEEALVILGGGQIDAVVLDLGLPDSQGIQSFRSLTEKVGDAAVVVVTHLEDVNLAFQAVKEGAQDYLFKGDLRGDLLVRAVAYAVERKKINKKLASTIGELQRALNEVDLLGRLLPICAECKKVRDDKGYWSQVEEYIGTHTGADFSHSLCPDCFREMYPQVYYRHQSGEEGQGDE